jgi:hypothetical protein
MREARVFQAIPFSGPHTGVHTNKASALGSKGSAGPCAWRYLVV